MAPLTNSMAALRVLLVAALLLYQPHLTIAVSLSDFAPEATNLTPGCEAVYNAQIPGCSATDFTSSPSTSAACSSSCIEGLVNTNSQVYNACSSDNQNNVQLIAAFLSGAGIQDLCPNVVVTTLVAGNIVQTTTLSTTSAGKINATVTAASDGSVVEASTTTTTATSSSSVSGTTMGSQVMAGTSVLVVPSSISGSMSEGIIVDTRTPTMPPSTYHTSTTTSVATASASSSSSDVVTTASEATTNTASSLEIITATSTTTKTTSTGTSVTAASSTSCTSAEHGGSPFNYCTTNGASSFLVTDPTILVLVIALCELLWLT